MKRIYCRFFFEKASRRWYSFEGKKATRQWIASVRYISISISATHLKLAYAWVRNLGAHNSRFFHVLWSLFSIWNWLTKMKRFKHTTQQEAEEKLGKATHCTHLPRAFAVEFSKLFAYTFIHFIFFWTIPYRSYA